MFVANSRRDLATVHARLGSARAAGPRARGERLRHHMAGPVWLRLTLAVPALIVAVAGISVALADATPARHGSTDRVNDGRASASPGGTSAAAVVRGRAAGAAIRRWQSHDQAQGRAVAAAHARDLRPLSRARCPGQGRCSECGSGERRGPVSAGCLWTWLRGDTAPLREPAAELGASRICRGRTGVPPRQRRRTRRPRRGRPHQSAGRHELRDLENAVAEPAGLGCLGGSHRPGADRRRGTLRRR